MLLSSNSRLSYRPTQSVTDNYKGLSGQKPASARTLSPSPMAKTDKRSDEQRTLRKLVIDQPLNPPQSRSESPSINFRSRSPMTNSLKSMVIEGKWKYTNDDDNNLRLKAMGIENLVTICYQMMNVASELANPKQEKRKKSPSQKNSWLMCSLDEFTRLNSAEKKSLNRAGVLNLMTIVYEAASTNASISNLVEIWREASLCSKKSFTQPLMSYERVFHYLRRKPNDQLLKIALHASLISTNSRSDLQRLGEKLGIKRTQFDMSSIKNSTEAFQNLIQFLHEQYLKQKRESKHIDTDRVPFQPKKKQGLYANVSGTKFHLIRQAVEMSGFLINPDTDFTCNLLWNDSLIAMDIVSVLKPYQKINHFPTMNEISRKDLLANNYSKLSIHIPMDYNFAPKTWILPRDYNVWFSYASSKPKKCPSVYIAKPINAAMGQGITIHCDYRQVQLMENSIIQEYIREPYLIDGFKFDLRIYALITSCDPLRVFIFDDGLVRMSSKKYVIPNSKNTLDLAAHLTNYIIDDKDTDDDLDLNNANKHSLRFLFEYLGKRKQDKSGLWKEIQDIVIKTIFLAEPHILATYRKCRPGALPTSESVCFELLGFDILIDKNLKPWLIEVNRCPSFGVDKQIEFDTKIKLLYDTFDLLHFRASDRKKSLATEKLEARCRLLSTIGKTPLDQINELEKMKQLLYLARQEKQRENFESRHAGGFTRLFPVNDQHQMIELINILQKCFQILSTNPDDLSWLKKYYYQYNEEELLYKITRLEDIYQTKHPESSTSNYVPNSGFTWSRISPSTSFIAETTDEEKEYQSSTLRSNKVKKIRSSTIDSFMKRVSTQTPPNIIRSSSLLSLKFAKQSPNSRIVTGEVSRSGTESDAVLPGTSAHRITEKKSYSDLSTSTSTSPKQDNQPRSSTTKIQKSNNKSQMVTQTSITQAYRQQEVNDQLVTRNITKELQLTDQDLNRLYKSIFAQMNKLCIRYPNKSDKETHKICTEITENWNTYKSDIGRYWLVEFDTDKRQSILDIVWNHVQQIMKMTCIIDELVQELPLHRHLMKLRRRLLANHGQCLWDACQNKDNSWESLFLKSTNHLSNIELECCYRFVDLCKQAVFVVYRYSTDTITHQQKTKNQDTTIIVKS